jgi:hypothetical protein
MKSVLVLLMLFAAAPVFANVGPPPDYPNETAEMVLIGSSAALTFLNIAGLSTEPSYWVGGIGIGVGTATLVLMTGENPRYEKGLFVSGTVSAVVGLITVLQRRVLDTRDSHARLEPSWSNGATGLAFVLDF